MTVDLTVTGEVQSLKLGPKDIVLVKVKAKVDRQSASDIKTLFQKYLQEAGIKNKVIVLSELVDIEVVKKT